MDPPPYEDVVQPRPPTPPPTYSVAVLPSGPPPTYGEADAFPVLAPPLIHPIAPPPGALDPATQTWLSGSPESGSHAPVVSEQPPSHLTLLAGVPAVVRCPYCQEEGTTEIEHKPGQAAWSLCVMLTLLGCVCGCCLIPFMVDSMQDVHHSCSLCHRHLHIHTR